MTLEFRHDIIMIKFKAREVKLVAIVIEFSGYRINRDKKKE